MFVYGLLTEPGEKSTVFTIFGSNKENIHSWLILQVNATNALGKRLPPWPFSWKYLFLKIGVWLLYSAVLVSTV